MVCWAWHPTRCPEGTGSGGRGHIKPGRGRGTVHRDAQPGRDSGITVSACRSSPKASPGLIGLAAFAAHGQQARALFAGGSDVQNYAEARAFSVKCNLLL